MGLIAWFPLSEGADNLVGSDGTVTGGIGEVDGRVGLMTRSDRLVSYDKKIARSVKSGVYSVSFQIYMGYLDQSHPWYAIISLHDTVSSAKKWRIERTRDRYGIAPDAPFPHGMQVWAPNGIGTYTSASLTRNWRHVVYIHNDQYRQFWVDGVRVSEDRTANTNVHNLTGEEVFILGAQNTDDVLSDVRIYDHALSDKEVKELAKAKVLHFKFDEQDLTTALVKDCSGFGNDGTVSVTAAPTWSEDSPVGRGSMEFSVSKSIVANRKIPLWGDSTVSFWANSQPSGTATLGCSRTAVGKGFCIFFSINGDIRWDTGDQQWSTGHAVKLNQWVHYTFVKRGDTKELYENAILVKSISYAGSMTALGGPYSIGMSQAGGSGYANPFNGTVADYRIYATALTPEDILELYQTRASVDNEGNLFVQEIDERDFDIVGRSKTIRVAGSGNNSPNKGIRGTYIDNVFHGYNSRGLNISVYDNALNRYASARFDTYANGSVAVDSYNNDFSSYTRTIGALAEVGAFLDLIPSGYIVAVISSDSIWDSVNDVLSTSLERALGAEKIRLAKGSRDHYTLLAYKNNGRPLYEDYKDNLSTTLTEAFSKEFNTETKLYGNGVFKANEFIETGVVGASVNDGVVYVNEIMET